MGVDWPPVDVIVSNPPFLGNRKLRPELGDEYVDALVNRFHSSFGDLTPDLVCYWHQKSLNHMLAGKVRRVGLLATNSIRGGTNRHVLNNIVDKAQIFNAWSDRQWILDGAAVRVSMICFDNGDEKFVRLDGVPAKDIFSDLTADIDLTGAKTLPENKLLSFQGIVKRGTFDMDVSLATSMIKADPKNRDVLQPIANAIDITRRPRESWIVDFGVGTPKEEAERYKLPFEYIEKNVKPMRQKTKQATSRKYWWLHWNSRPTMRRELANLHRYIATPIVAKHRVFVWMGKSILPDKRLTVFARDDDYSLGVLHSALHELWSLRLGSWHGKGNDPRYTPTTTFETFPFPWSPGHEDTSHPAHATISAAAAQLHQERHAWLNPEGASDKELKDRTLTNVYNALQVFRGNDSMKTKPAAADFAPRLDELHQTLDHAVCDAYGWEHDILADEEEILRRLLSLNLERAATS